MVTIGLVLSRTPAYSETFFISKIKGLMDSGFNVILFVQENNNEFGVCEVRLAPKVYKRKPIRQSFRTIWVILKLMLGRWSGVLRFVKLERSAERSWFQITKNIYNNSHILSARIDWLHFGFATMAIQSEHVAKAINSRMAVSLRGFDMDVYPKTHPDCYKLLWKNVDKVHAISKYMLRQALNLGLDTKVPFQIITPAIQVSNYKAKIPSITSPVSLLTIARLHWIKGLKDTFKAMVILKSQGIEFNYKIIGEGPEEEELNQLITTLELQDCVQLAGKMPHQDTLQYLAEADVYVQFSESEGFCNAVLEAQALGLLCVVSDGGALPENVIHETTGWVVPKKNPDALATRILNVIHLPQPELQKISIAAQDRVYKRFNLIMQQEQFQQFYYDGLK